MRVWIAIAVALGLSGCLSSDPSGGGTLANLEATVDTGILAGVVVDVTVRPVADALVAVSGPDGFAAQTITDFQGLFGLDGLQPGAYFVNVSKDGYESVRQGVVVEAGEEAPPLARIILEPVPTLDPYFRDFRFDGFFDCSAAAGGAWMVCSIEDGAFHTEIDVDGTPTFVQAELVWQPSLPTAQHLTLHASGQGGDEGVSFNSSSGESPVLMQIPQADWGAVDGEVLQFVVTIAPHPATAPACIPDPVWPECFQGAGVAFAQSFTIVTHVFYGYQPPAEWRFTNDGAPVVRA